MREYKVENGEILFEGEGRGVIFSQPQLASVTHIATALQQAYNAGRISMLTEIQEKLGIWREDRRVETSFVKGTVLAE